MTLEKKLLRAKDSNDVSILHDVFSEIYVNYIKLVYFKISQYIKNTQDIEELTQDVFISFFNMCLRLEIKNIKYYLMVTSKNKALDFIKHKKEQIILDNDKIYEEENRLSTSVYDEILGLMKQYLNDFEIEIILKYNIEGLKFKEISKELNKPINSILSTYYRAIKKFNKGVNKK